MALSRYNPTARPSNTDGPGNTHTDYGSRPPGSMTRDEQWQARQDQYGMSPWYSGGQQMPWAADVPDRGQRVPFYTPDPSDPRNAGYFVQPDPAKEAAWNAQHAQDVATQKALRDAKINSPEMQALLNSEAYRQVQATGNKNAMRGMQADVMTAGSRMPGGPSASAGGIVPRSPLGAYSHGPGRPDWDTRFTNPPPPGVAPPGASQVTGGGGIGGVAGPAKAGGTGMSYGSYGGGGAAPSGGGGNMMIASQGGGGGYGQYLGGGGNMGGGNMMVSQGGGGGYGQYLGGGGGNMGGGVGTSFAINNPFAFNGGMTMGGGNPGASMGGGETGYMYGGGMGGGMGGGQLSPQSMLMLMSQMPGGGSGWGGMRPGYAPYDAGNYNMPYDMMGMGQWY